MVTVAAGTDTLSKLRGGPHWEVVIHPSRFEAKRVSTLRECRDAVEQAQVALLPGRQYPRIDRQSQEQGQDWVASAICFPFGHREYSRLYQSGQFVHFFTFPEDTWNPEEMQRAYDSTLVIKPENFTPSGFLSVIGALYTFAEIFEFAARFMAADVLDEAPTVRIVMHQAKDRVLVPPGRRIGPVSLHTATAETPEHEWQLTGPGIYGEAARLAREAARWFFERFGCHDFPEESLKREQDEFLAKRGLRV